MREGDPNGKETVYVAATPASPAAAELADYAGDYHSPELDVIFQFVVQGERLVLRRRKFSDRALHPTLADGFTDARAQFDFTRDEAGRIDGFALSTGRIRRLRFARLEPPANR